MIRCVFYLMIANLTIGYMLYLNKYFMVPSLLWFQPIYKDYVFPLLPESFSYYRETDTMLNFFTLWGIFLSLLLFVGRPRVIQNSTSYAVLWLIYLSNYSGGDRFMSFQWDILLLECGFLSIFFAPLWHSDLYDVTPSVSLVRELLRWLAFRLMFASGLVKLLSKCPTWWGLTALQYHFET